MNPAAAQPTPAPLHDIVGPVWFWPYPAGATLLGGVLLVALAVLAGWGLSMLFRRRRVDADPRRRAISALAVLETDGAGCGAQGFGAAVSDILRAYMVAEHGLRATTQTSVEFLEDIRRRAEFSEDERAGLAVFLGKTDLLKFANQDGDGEVRTELLAIARRVIEAGGNRVK